MQAVGSKESLESPECTFDIYTSLRNNQSNELHSVGSGHPLRKHLYGMNLYGVFFFWESFKINVTSLPIDMLALVFHVEIRKSWHPTSIAMKLDIDWMRICTTERCHKLMVLQKIRRSSWFQKQIVFERQKWSQFLTTVYDIIQDKFVQSPFTVPFLELIVYKSVEFRMNQFLLLLLFCRMITDWLVNRLYNQFTVDWWWWLQTTLCCYYLDWWKVGKASFTKRPWFTVTESCGYSFVVQQDSQSSKEDGIWTCMLFLYPLKYSLSVQNSLFKDNHLHSLQQLKWRTERWLS